MLEKDYLKRISIEDAFKHEWVQQRASDTVLDKPVCVNAFEKLNKFKISHKLSHAVLEFIAAHYSTEHEVEDLRQAFI